MIAGRYTLVREIGRGGMGVVWLAQDELLGRQVALKRIGMLPGATEPDLRRAESEGRLAAALNHPHVVGVYDMAEQDGEHWLVMEFIDGPSLSTILKEQGTIPHARAARLLSQAADALAAAHTAGIVHRDVKPSNMLVGAGDELKLADFGIARATADPSLTMTGTMTGFAGVPRPRGRLGRLGDLGERRLVHGRHAVPRALRQAALRLRRERHRWALPHRARGSAPARGCRLVGPDPRGDDGQGPG